MAQNDVPAVKSQSVLASLVHAGVVVLVVVDVPLLVGVGSHHRSSSPPRERKALTPPLCRGEPLDPMDALTCVVCPNVSRGS